LPKLAPSASGYNLHKRLFPGCYSNDLCFAPSHFFCVNHRNLAPSLSEFAKTFVSGFLEWHPRSYLAEGCSEFGHNFVFFGVGTHRFSALTPTVINVLIHWDSFSVEWASRVQLVPPTSSIPLVYGRDERSALPRPVTWLGVPPTIFISVNPPHRPNWPMNAETCCRTHKINLARLKGVCRWPALVLCVRVWDKVFCRRWTFIFSVARRTFQRSVCVVGSRLVPLPFGFVLVLKPTLSLRSYVGRSFVKSIAFTFSLIYPTNFFQSQTSFTSLCPFCGF
jgi:hypothetical protein